MLQTATPHSQHHATLLVASAKKDSQQDGRHKILCYAGGEMTHGAGNMDGAWSCMSIVIGAMQSVSV